MKITTETSFWRTNRRPDRVGNIHRDEKTPSWIEKHQQGNGNQLPILPAFLLPLVNNYTPNTPITTNIEVIPVSGQMWHSFLEEERNQLLELAEWLGVHAEDYVRLFESQIPFTPKGK